jgi:hypothetical protein
MINHAREKAHVRKMARMFDQMVPARSETGHCSSAGGLRHLGGSRLGLRLELTPCSNVIFPRNNAMIHKMVDLLLALTQTFNRDPPTSSAKDLINF